MDKEILFEGKHLVFIKDQGWEYVDRKKCTGIAVILPVTENYETILVEQYRVPVGRSVIGFPAGLAGDEHDEAEPLEPAALRELEEETGYRAAKITRLIDTPPSPGLCSEVLTFFLATELVQISQGGGVESENITVHRVPLHNIDAWLHEKIAGGNIFIDLKTYAGLYLLQNKINCGFALPDIRIYP